MEKASCNATNSVTFILPFVLSGMDTATGRGTADGVGNAVATKNKKSARLAEEH
jgi:hypothetical protein